jgi:hypothetical protein
MQAAVRSFVDNAISRPSTHRLNFETFVYVYRQVHNLGRQTMQNVCAPLA